MIFRPTPIEASSSSSSRTHRRARLLRPLVLRDEFADAGLETTCRPGQRSLTTAAGTLRGMHFQRAGGGGQVRALHPRRHLRRDLRPAKGLSHLREALRRRTHRRQRAGLLPPEVSPTASRPCTTPPKPRIRFRQPYTPNIERGLRYDDPLLAIDWPLAVTMVSDKDRTWPEFSPDSAIDLT